MPAPTTRDDAPTKRTANCWRSCEAREAGARIRAPYQVSLKGRWSELDFASGAKDKVAAPSVPRTPLAGRSLEVEIEDAQRQPAMSR